MRRCVASTWPDSKLKRMNLPRRPTLEMRALRSWRSKPGREMPGAMRLRFSSAATMRRPVTTGDKARTTCSTSGSSGITRKQFHAKAQRKTQSRKEEFCICFLSVFASSFAPLREMSLFLFSIDDRFDLFLDLVYEWFFAGFDVETQEWFGVGAADVEAPFGRFE